MKRSRPRSSDRHWCRAIGRSAIAELAVAIRSPAEDRAARCHGARVGAARTHRGEQRVLRRDQHGVGLCPPAEPFPSSPPKFVPQQYTLPERPTPHENWRIAPPALTTEKPASLGGSVTATGAGSIWFPDGPSPTAPSPFQPQQYGAPARARAHAWLLSVTKPPTLTAEKLTPADAAICCGVVKPLPGDPLPSWPAISAPQQ